MKKLIRKIVNWAYGVNVLLELDIMDNAKTNLSTTMNEIVGVFYKRIKMLEEEVERLKKKTNEQ